MIADNIPAFYLLIFGLLNLWRLSLLGLALVFGCGIKHSHTRLWITKHLRLSAAFFSAGTILLTERDFSAMARLLEWFAN